MTTRPQEPDPLDRILRDVALPTGFLDRLRAISSEVEEPEMTAEEIAALDASLRWPVEDAPLVVAYDMAPSESASDSESAQYFAEDGESDLYLERSATGSHELSDQDETFSDGQIDRWLRRVRLPAGLIFRLHQIRGLVAHAEGSQDRTRAFGPGGASVGRASQLSIAAALMIAFGLFYFGAAATYLMAYHAPRRSGDPAFPLTVNNWNIEPERPDHDGPDADVEQSFVLSPFSDDWQSTLSSVEMLNVLGSESLPPTPEEVVLPPAVISGLDPGSRLANQSPLGFPPGSESVEEDERYPEPEIVPWEVIRGIAPPKAAGFDLPFLIRNGVHPMVPVDPRFRADPGLRFCQVPLRSESFSYEQYRRMLGLDRPELPEPRDVRVEDFLAAIDYGWEAPREKDGKQEGLRLVVHGAPSPFKNSGNAANTAARSGSKMVQLPPFPGMIQVGVKAREEVEGWRQACRLTVLVDRSRSMRRGGRMEMTRQALGELAGRMGPADRLSLVAFDREASVLLEDAAVQDAVGRTNAGLAIAALTAGSSTNLAAGFRAAYAVAANYPRHDRLEHRVVLITDGADVSEATLGELESRLASAANSGIVLSVIDLGEGAWVSAPLLRLAEAGRGRAVRASSSEQIRWALCEAMSGRSQLVASKVQLRVEFNPDSIESYRLIGHEASDLGRREGAALEVDLRAGQSATALFEIRPRRTDGPIATIELRWRDAYGAEQRQVQTLVGAEFSPRFEDAPVALQRAAIAAEAAEILRDSPFVEKGMTLAKLADFAARVRRESTGDVSFQRFVELLDRAAAVEAGRGSAPSNRRP